MSGAAGISPSLSGHALQGARAAMRGGKAAPSAANGATSVNVMPPPSLFNSSSGGTDWTLIAVAAGGAFLLWRYG